MQNKFAPYFKMVSSAKKIRTTKIPILSAALALYKKIILHKNKRTKASEERKLDAPQRRD